MSIYIRQRGNSDRRVKMGSRVVAKLRPDGTPYDWSVHITGEQKRQVEMWLKRHATALTPDHDK